MFSNAPRFNRMEFSTQVNVITSFPPRAGRRRRPSMALEEVGRSRQSRGRTGGGSPTWPMRAVRGTTRRRSSKPISKKKAPSFTWRQSSVTRPAGISDYTLALATNTAFPSTPGRISGSNAPRFNHMKFSTQLNATTSFPPRAGRRRRPSMALEEVGGAQRRRVEAAPEDFAELRRQGSGRQQQVGCASTGGVTRSDERVA